MTGNLYDRDVVAWSEQQAALLRRRAPGELVNDADLDWPNTAEEIESVGTVPGRYRRLSKDYEFRVQTSEAMIDLAAIRLCSIVSYAHRTFRTLSQAWTLSTQPTEAKIGCNMLGLGDRLEIPSSVEPKMR